MQRSKNAQITYEKKWTISVGKIAVSQAKEELVGPTNLVYSYWRCVLEDDV